MEVSKITTIKLRLYPVYQEQSCYSNIIVFYSLFYLIVHMIRCFYFLPVCYTHLCEEGAAYHTQVLP